MENKNNLKISLKDIIDILFRNKISIFITFGFCIVVTFIGIQFITPVYDANVKMLVRGQNVISSETYAPIMGRVHMTQAEIVKSYPVLKRAAIALNLQNRPLNYENNYCSSLKKFYVDYKTKKTLKKIEEFSEEKRQEILLGVAIDSLRSRLKVSMVPGTDIFIINVTAYTPEEAIETANIISRSYTMFDQIQQLAEVTMKYGEFHPTVIQLKDNIENTTQNLSGKPLPDIEAIGTASVKIIEQAVSNNMPVSTPKRIILAGALFVSLCISLGIAVLKGLFDRSIKSPQDIADYLDIPCIGSIPEKKRKDKYLITDDSPETKYYEFYEELAEQLYVFLKTQGRKTVVITSPAYNSNHKYIIPNLGYFLTRKMGNNVLLVDINFHKPHFQKTYSIDDERGIDGHINMEMSHELVYKMNNGPDVIPAKKVSEKPLIVFRNVCFRNFIEKNKNNYNIILLDGTLINNMKDASSISEYTDGTVVIIDEGKLNRQMLKNSLPRFNRNDSIIMGCILNNRTFPVPDFVYKNFKYLID